MRQSQSAPSLRSTAPSLGGQRESIGSTMKSTVVGNMAQTMGAKLSSTLHHRGEHEVGPLVDPKGDHVYVPRAHWTQSHDFPLRSNNAEWNQQHFMASELKRIHGEEKYKEYMKREIDRQLQDLSDRRTRMRNEKQEFGRLLNADMERAKQAQGKKDGEHGQAVAMMLSSQRDQQNNLAKRSQESRVREAQELAEMKMRTVQQMCEEMAETQRRKQQLKKELQQGLQNNENQRRTNRTDKQNQNEEERQAIRQSLMMDEYRNQAAQQKIKEYQDREEARIKMYERTAGKAENERNHAEVTRIDNDEKKHMLRADTFYAQRERAREQQRQKMVEELDRQNAAGEEKRESNRRAREAERQAAKEANKRSLDAEMAKAAQKLSEEKQLQQELREMILEKEERDAREGYTKPTAVSTMNYVMRKNGNACHKVSDLQSKMEAPTYLGKPLGREDNPGAQKLVPFDAPGSVLRRLEKSYVGDVPLSSTLGGVAGTLGGGGGPIHSALMATGGPHLRKSIGIAIQDIKMDSAWHSGLKPEHHKAGRKEARKREAARAEANKVY